MTKQISLCEDSDDCDDLKKVTPLDPVIYKTYYTGQRGI